MDEELRLYESLLLTRRVEQEVARVYPTDRIQSPIHLSIGQEAISVGIAAALCPEDVVFGTYRGHAIYIARGGNLDAMIAELYGRATGCSRGKGGSMHLVDTKAGLRGMSSIVATGIPQAVGHALALKYTGRPGVVACFFGDGATEEGVFHESMNFAALRKLPVLFICENNGCAIHSRQEERQANPDLCARAAVYGMPTRKVADNDVHSVRDTARAALAAIRAGGGPMFLECVTCRWNEHVGPGEDWGFGYRSRAEAEKWIASDSLAHMAGTLPAASRAAIDARVEAKVAAAFAFAEASPFPEPDELTQHVFVS